MQPVAFAHNGYTDKFGIPRQSGRVEAVETKIVFTAPFRNPDAIRGIEQWSHLWLIWGGEKTDNVLTVRPPRLGGNTRLGVFATRSPFRPNGLCLSSVRLLRVEETPNEGYVLVVSGADLMNGTPIYDIKPYLPYTDSHPEATNGFAEEHKNDALTVFWSLEAEKMLTSLCHDDNCQLSIIHYQLTQVLREDPRPAYQDDPERIYGLTFDGYNVRFQVQNDVLRVIEIAKI